MNEARNLEKETEGFRQRFQSVRDEVAKVIVGQDSLVRDVLITLFARGHVLIEGLPGLGKTLLVRTLGAVLDLEFSRIQFTPDLMPADLLGSEILDDSSPGGRRFQQGPLFANLVLADEINRASPKTQSALLESMQEGTITFLGRTFLLPQPFLLMATQNPIDLEGTYPLPEAQRDRFFCQLNVRYPDEKELLAIADRTTGILHPQVNQVLSHEQILEMSELVREVPIGETVKQYAASIILATQPGAKKAPNVTKKYIRFGASPRGLQALIFAGKILALLDGRYHVSREDIREFALPALRHRIILNFEGLSDGETTDSVIEKIIEEI